MLCSAVTFGTSSGDPGGKGSRELGHALRRHCQRMTSRDWGTSGWGSTLQALTSINNLPGNGRPSSSLQSLGREAALSPQGRAARGGGGWSAAIGPQPSARRRGEGSGRGVPRAAGFPTSAGSARAARSHGGAISSALPLPLSRRAGGRARASSRTGGLRAGAASPAVSPRYTRKQGGGRRGSGLRGWHRPAPNKAMGPGSCVALPAPYK